MNRRTVDLIEKLKAKAVETHRQNLIEGAKQKRRKEDKNVNNNGESKRKCGNDKRPALER